jgi:hypothetical protein
MSLRRNNIYDFRGAFIDMAVTSGKLKDHEITLLANREYSGGQWGKESDQYPKVQYRVEDGQAVLFALEEGVDVLEKLIHYQVFDDFVMRNRNLPLHIQSSYKQERSIKTASKGETYMLFHYIPYDHYNDHDYHSAETMKDKVEVLEKTLSHAVNGTLRALGQKKAESTVTLIDIIHKDKAVYKTKDKDGKPYTEEVVSYFMKIRCNIAGLDQFAIGKHKSLGYGVLKKLIK